TVMERARPDYDRPGVRVGSFIAKPTIGVNETYDSNIYATPSATSDFYTSLTPGISLQSDWGRHALAFNASADVSGRYDISTGSYLVFKVERIAHIADQIAAGRDVVATAHIGRAVIG